MRPIATPHPKRKAANCMKLDAKAVPNDARQYRNAERNKVLRRSIESAINPAEIEPRMVPKRADDMATPSAKGESMNCALNPSVALEIAPIS